MAKRFHIPWNAPPTRAAASAWDKIELWQRGAKRFISKHGRSRRVFINHMADFLDNQAEQSWRTEACLRMESAPDVIFIIVTKRPQNAHRMLPPHWFRPGKWPANVWFIVTAENQEEYDRRVFHMMDIPAKVRGTSMEPLLGEIRPWAFNRSAVEIALEIQRRVPGKRAPMHIRQQEWAIIGGESGPKARPMPDKAMSMLVGAGGINGVAIFVKQLSQASNPGKSFKDYANFPLPLQVREFPAS
jgi:protein gp37